MYAYDAINRLDTIDDLLGTDDIVYAYDSNGNTLSKTKAGVTTEFKYDLRNQLSEVQQGPSTLGRYGYDSEGLRILKIGNDGRRHYTYDQLSVITEANAANTTVSKYNYGLDQLVSLDNTVEGRSFFHLDILRSTANLTDASGGTRQSILYDAWGNERDRVGTSANKFTFTGHEKDEETGLIYAKARFYDPDIGRFLTQDSFLGDASNAPSLHRYFYTNQNPLLFVDPTGFQSEFVPNLVDEDDEDEKPSYLQRFLGWAPGALARFLNDSSDDAIREQLEKEGKDASFLPVREYADPTIVQEESWLDKTLLAVANAYQWAVGDFNDEVADTVAEFNNEKLEEWVPKAGSRSEYNQQQFDAANYDSPLIAEGIREYAIDIGTEGSRKGTRLALEVVEGGAAGKTIGVAGGVIGRAGRRLDDVDDALTAGGKQTVQLRVVNPHFKPKRHNVGPSGHHVPAVRKARGRPFAVGRGDKTRPTLFSRGKDPGYDHWRMHRAEKTTIGSTRGPFSGTDDELFDAYRQAYDGLEDIRVDVRSPNGKIILGTDVSPREGVDLIEDWLRSEGLR